MANNFPKRKHPRLKRYDYSTNGYYFVTICTEHMRCIFGTVEQYVGRGLAPAAYTCSNQKIVLSAYGKIAEKQLFALENRYDFVQIDRYVIMPNHIHAILVFDGKTAGAKFSEFGDPLSAARTSPFLRESPRPTLSDVLCAYKSLTTRECNAYDNKQGQKIFQASFYDRVIRDETGYLQACQYIDENPRKWKNDAYYK